MYYWHSAHRKMPMHLDALHIQDYLAFEITVRAVRPHAETLDATTKEEDENMIAAGRKANQDGN